MTAALARRLAALPGIDRAVCVVSPSGEPAVERALRSGTVEIRDDPAGSCAAIPIVTTGGPWGAAVLWSARTPFPRDCLDAATGLVEVAAAGIGANESRLRLIAELDRTYADVERELHDGVLQRLTTTGMELQLLRDELPASLAPATLASLASVVEQMRVMAADVRALSRRTFPAILPEAGLGPALRSLARHAALPVELDLPPLRRYPPLVETTVYQVVASVARHAARAHARHVSVTVADDRGRLRLSVSHDGAGDRDLLDGVVRDRLDALGAGLSVRAAPGGGVAVRTDLPVPEATTG